MPQVYVTGDTHSNFKRFSLDSFPEQREMTRDDHVIICGDFGLVWDAGGESKSEQYWLNWLEEKSYTTLFIDGNHDNRRTSEMGFFCCRLTHFSEGGVIL